jgi:hypothetical protein
MMIVHDDARIINKLDASLTDDARVIIYDRHMFIVQATGLPDPLDENKGFVKLGN